MRAGSVSKASAGSVDNAAAGRLSGAHCALSALAGLTLLAIAGGCAAATGPVADLHDAGELNRLVSQSSQPVLVDFYKQGCENCAAFEKTMGRLSGEYTGRVVFAEFMLMRANGAAASPELAEKYDILFYPTAILFRSGLPVKTFVTDYDIADYRAALGQPTSRPAGR